MKKLGIVVSLVDRKEPEKAAPSYPLLAFSYTRSGFIRLAGLKNFKK